MTIRLGGKTFILIESPGHTRGQTVVHAVEDHVAFTADNLTPAYNVACHSADLWGWFQSLGVLEALDVDWYVPGHGRPCQKSEIPRQREKLHELIDKVRVLKNVVGSAARRCRIRCSMCMRPTSTAWITWASASPC